MAPRPRPPAKRASVRKAAAKKAPARKAAAKKAPARKTTAKKAPVRKAAAKKAPVRKTAAKKAPARKATAKKASVRKAAAKKAPARKAAAKKAPARKATAKKASVRKAPARKATAKRTSSARNTTVNHSPGTALATRRSANAKRGGSGSTGRASEPRRVRRSRSLPITQLGERYAAYLMMSFVGLTLFGLVMVLSASSVPSLHEFGASPFYQFRRQLMWSALGAIGFLVASRVDYRMLRKLARPLMALSILLLLLVIIPGVGTRAGGSTRWLTVGPVGIQPAELAKISLIVFIADLLSSRERRMDRPELTVRPVMLTVYGTSALLLLQPKLGTPVIMAAVALVMLFVAGARLRNMLAWTMASAGAVLLIAFATGYQSARIDGWLRPWDDPEGAGAQLIQSQVGIASGGFYGLGLGASRAKWGFLPEAQTDFIFAIVAEETGLIGASALIGAFVLIGWIGLRVSMAAPDRFGMLLAAGITGWLLIQAFLNIGMVIGVMPITGEALPFVSAGGSALLMALTSAGLLVSVARRAKA